MSDVQVFVDAWNAIDTRGKGHISVQDLWMYMKRINANDTNVNKFMNLFDADNSGIVTLEEFCRVLGLSQRELLIGGSVSSHSRVRVHGGVGAAGELPAGVELISGDMDQAWQIKLSQLCLEGLRSTASVRDVPKWIKTQADRQYNQLWHVVMVNGQFWCYYGHEPGYSFVFRYEKYIFIVWKTPVV